MIRVLLLIFSLAWIPLQAFAQLPLPCVPGLTCPHDTTPPTVRITSPASGATVSGTITVTADAWDDNGVAGVQFKYNDINFDSEKTSSDGGVPGHHFRGNGIGQREPYVDGRGDG